MVRLALFLAASLTIAFTATVLVLLTSLQRKLIYFPDPTSVPLPAEDVRAGFQAVVIATVDGPKLQAWYRPAPVGTWTVLFLHGNAGNRSTRLDLLRRLVEMDLGVLALDYRGYGGSEGSPTEEGLYADAEAAAHWLSQRGVADIVYFGESLGTGVAVELARRLPPGRLVLQAPFDSLVAVGRRAYPFLPVSWLLRDRFASYEKIAQVHVPLLVLHGTEDRIVPIEHGRRLYARAPEPKRFVAIEGFGHNDLRTAGDAFYRPLSTFLLNDSRLRVSPSEESR